MALIACAATGYIAALSTIPQDSQLTEQISILQGNLDAKEEEIKNIQSQLQEYENLITALNQEIQILKKQSGADNNNIPEIPSVQTETEGKIAFQTYVGSTSYIHVINPDGTNEARLTEGWNPKWSPDGNKIAFSISRHLDEPVGGSSFTPDLYVMNADGTEITKVTESAYSFSWSPDQRIFLFESYGDIYTVSIDGGNLVRLTETGDYEKPTFSPDGEKIAFASVGWASEWSDRNFSIYTMNFDGTGKTMIYFEERPSGLTFEDILWSPKGDKIVYGLEYQIYIINIDGTSRMGLAEGYYAAWSPDGEKIAYARDWCFYIMNPDGTDTMKLFDKEVDDRWAGYLSWSPDGKQIVFVENEEDIYIVNIDGTGTTQLIESSNMCWNVQWSPS